MNFIWDIVLQAEAQGIDKTTLLFQQAKQYSPYYEQAFAYINQDRLDDSGQPPVIELNALYRFSHIFQVLLHPDLMAQPENRDIGEAPGSLFDMLMHLLSEIDLKYGLTRREYFIRRLWAELSGGGYGPAAATAMASLPRPLQFRLAGELLLELQTGASLRIFCRTVRAVFPASILYQSNYDNKQLLVYLGTKDTAANVQILQLLLDLFLPCGFSTHIFWQYHFGILGVDATMKSDQIALF